MNCPLFSIITVTYNAAQTLPPTLKSVQEQTFTDYEHLIIDGASTDATLELARVKAPAQRKIYSEPDHGLYDAMNKGLAHARGRYLIFLNAGDTFSTTETLSQYAAATASGPDIIYADTRLVDSDRRVLGPRHLSAPEVLTFKSFAHGMLVCHQAFCVRRDLAPDYDMRYRFSADYDWCLKCLKSSSPDRCVNLHIVAIDYLSEGVTTSNHRASLLERFRIMSRAYGMFPTLVRHSGFLLRAVGKRLKK